MSQAWLSFADIDLPGIDLIYRYTAVTVKDECKVKLVEKLQWRDVVDLALSETSSRQSELFEDV